VDNASSVEQERRSPREPGLDLLRTIAILLVVLYHMALEPAPRFLRGIEQCGWMGVDLFFVLSGFLIGSQLFRPYLRNQTPSLWLFYLRRAFRILPAFWVVLLVYLLIPGVRERPAMPDAWRFLTFTQNLGLIAPAAFSHAWSLCVEEHFYLAFPILVLWLMRKPSFWKVSTVAAIVFLGGFIIRWIIWTHYLQPMENDPAKEHLFFVGYWELIYFPTYARLDGLLVGVLLAAIRQFRPDWWAFVTARRGIVLIIAVLLLSLAVSTCWYLVRFSAVVWGFPLIALGFGFLVIASTEVRIGIPGTVIGATLAYSTYLTHKAVMHLDRIYFSQWLNANWISAFFIYTSSSLIVATVLYLCIEAPSLRLREKFISSIRARRPLVTPAPGLVES